MKSYSTIDGYIESFPKEVQKSLQQVRATIAKVAPQAEEAIRYGIPTFRLKGNLVHFAGYANHIGFYPGATGIAAFKKELSKYKTSKGTVQFPLTTVIPFPLIRSIVKFRVRENMKTSR